MVVPRRRDFARDARRRRRRQPRVRACVCDRSYSWIFRFALTKNAISRLSTLPSGCWTFAGRGRYTGETSLIGESDERGWTMLHIGILGLYYVNIVFHFYRCAFKCDCIARTARLENLLTRTKVRLSILRVERPEHFYESYQGLGSLVK